MLKLDTTIKPHQGEKILYSGQDPDKAKSAMIMIHGRGATAESMLPLAKELSGDEITFVIPQATGFAWYPYRFIEKRERNEPGITSALMLIQKIYDALKNYELSNNIYLLGFSQGACLAADFAARYRVRFGGVFILSGGLIGERINRDGYKGDLKQTPVFLGCSDDDFHIPENRVHESAQVFKNLNADVTKRIYHGMGHTINDDEIEFIKGIITQGNNPYAAGN